MVIPAKISIYIIKHFLIAVLVSLFVFSLLIFIIDIMELVRRSHNKEIPFSIIIKLAFLKYPLMGQKIMPFIILIGAIITYTKLTKSQELIVIRASGVSIWQFLLPSCFAAFVIGVLMFTIINPISCKMIAKYEIIEGKYFKGKNSYLDISKYGIWLRQKNTTYTRDNLPRKNGETIIHASSAEGSEDIVLSNVTILVFDGKSSKEYKFSRRIDAAIANLLPDYDNDGNIGFWHLKNVLITSPNGISTKHDEYFLETDLTVNDIHDSFASPATISFWELPGFVETLKKSGFSAIPHKLYWHNLLTTPFLYSSMIFIAALFSMRPTRQGGAGMLVTGSIITGFVIYFFTNLISSLALSSSLPIIVSAWIPVAAFLLLGGGLLLHYEDG